MSTKSDKELFNDILFSIEKIESYIEQLGYQDFLNDEKTQDAVIRNIEIIGESSGKISQKTKNKYPGLPWDKIKGTRNRLIHNYSGINLDILWNIIKDDLPNLYIQIKQMNRTN